ncbi:MAG TPA: MFS transporter [Vicinamibacterales bacterium]|nr:MFS transporter [Vicinamibacterales bacterium]
MSRPLLVIFLTVFVNLVGFGIIIPLLPFYAETFGASPVVIGFLFAAFSLAQLVAAPILGVLSDRFGRRPVLIFSLIGTAVSFVMLAMAQSLFMLFAARIIDGLSGGNITIARAYIADVTEPDERAKAFGFLGAAFGLGFIVGPGLAGLFSHISYTAPIWAAVVVTLMATVMAAVWLPETVHRGSAVTVSPLRALPDVLRRRNLRPLLLADFVYWSSFALCTTTFALFASRRFGFDVAHTGYVLAGFGLLGVIVQAGLVGVVARRLGVTRTLLVGLVIASAGWTLVALSGSVPVFLLSLIPAGIGVGLCNAAIVTLVSHSASREEQGAMQGAAGALESLGRAIGPVWGHGTLQRFGEGSAYGTAALAFLATMVLMLGYKAPEN